MRLAALLLVPQVLWFVIVTAFFRSADVHAVGCVAIWVATLWLVDLDTI